MQICFTDEEKKIIIDFIVNQFTIKSDIADPCKDCPGCFGTHTKDCSDKIEYNNIMHGIDNQFTKTFNTGNGITSLDIKNLFVKPITESFDRYRDAYREYERTGRILNEQLNHLPFTETEIAELKEGLMKIIQREYPNRDIRDTLL